MAPPYELAAIAVIGSGRGIFSAFTRFALVGGGFAALNLALLAILVQCLGLTYLWAATISFFLLNFAAYRLNKLITFDRGITVDRSELFRYYAVMAANLPANLGLMFLLVEVVQMHYLYASLLVTVALSVANFLGHRNVTFSITVKPITIPRTTLNVLQISAFFPAHGGGIEAVAGQLARRLPATHTQMTWMAGGPPEERYQKDGANFNLLVEQARSVDFLERHLGLPSPLWSINSLAQLKRCVRSADVVHVHDYLYMPTLAAMVFAALYRKPVILTQHIGDIAFKSTIARTTLRLLNRTLGHMVLSWVSQVVFVGRPVQAYFQRFIHFRHVPLLIANGVDHQRYFPLDQRSAPAPPAKLLFVGRFVEKKGLALLRQCVDLPNTRWTFIGRGPLSPVQWEAATPEVEVLAPMPASEVVPYYQQAHLLVLPSTGEGFPLVIQEALACGTPVLVSREVADAFPVKDDRCVFDVELRVAKPAEALRAALSKLLANPEQLQDARAHARLLSTQWSWNACAEQYRAAYHEVVNR